MTLQFVLEDEGFEVLAAADGESALDLARRSNPDVILLDQVMPKLDGKQVLRALREDPQTGSIPVIVLTGMERGGDDAWPDTKFIGKPFAPDDLVATIRNLLQSDQTG